MLLAGPTEAGIGAGIRSAIDLIGEFVELGGEEQILAVAQLVLTATAVAGIERVRFALDGEGLSWRLTIASMIRGRDSSTSSWGLPIR